MRIGIIGVGALGGNFACVLAKAGISATIADSRGPESLASLVGELGASIKADTVEEAARADIVLAAIRWVDIEKVFGRLPTWNGRIVIDGTNPFEFLDPNSSDAKDPSNPLAAYGIKAVKSWWKVLKRGVQPVRSGRISLSNNGVGMRWQFLPLALAVGLKT